MTTPPDPDQSFVAGYVLYLLAASSERASAQFHAQVRTHGLRVPEWRVLACLVDRDGLMITHLAELALMEQSRMTRIIDQMHNRGLVERAPDADDKRRVRVQLTQAGRTLAETLVTEARAHEAELLSRLKGTDAGEVKQVLRAILSTLEEETP